ncbi:MAG: hypothetical protein FD123_3881 [Bacteroidetes bacterium]|nr:MAG: hypothetical protein FD123_3881 [Bacteroidota bacterium]
MDRKQKYRIAGYCIKTAIAVFAVVYIGYKIYRHRHDFDLLSAQLTVENLWWLWIPVLLLGAINWMLEAQKWRFLVAPVERISLSKSVQVVLAGVALGVATPNRTGEFLSRIFSLSAERKGEALVLAGVGSFAQFLVSVLMGLLGFLVLKNRFTLPLFNDQYWVWLLLGFLFALVLVFLVLLFVETWRVIIFNLPGLRRYKKYFDILSEMTLRGHFTVFLFSLLRYLAYATQFVLLLRLCGVVLDPYQAYAMVAVTYFAVTVIPSFALSEVVVRGSAAMVFIGEPAQNPAGALAASLIIWFINIVIPALAGIVFIYRLRFFGKREEDGTT